MAAPIAHIFLAIQMLSGPFEGCFDEKEFILGTSFPDIRYLKVVERAETHFVNVAIDDILKERNSFKAGMLFHSFVDEQREAFVVKHNFYTEIPEFRFTTQSLKFAEDEILKAQFNVQDYQSYFNDILNEQKSYGISDEHIQTWHEFLQNYFNGDYSGKDLIMRYFDLNDPNAWHINRVLFSWYYAQKMEQLMTIIIGNDQLKGLILDFYENFMDRVTK